MMNYEAMLDKKYLGECLKTPKGAVEAYRYVLDNPEMLGELSKEEAKTFYVIVNLSQRECPRFYGKGFVKKPDNGFLNYLFSENPYLDEKDNKDKKEFLRAARAFTPAEMKRMQRSGGNPLECKLNGSYIGREDGNNRKIRTRKSFLNPDDGYYRMFCECLGSPVPSVVLAEEGCGLF